MLTIQQLGKHRLMCGDSSNINDMSLLMGNIKADMIFIDPPYGINYEGCRYDLRKKKQIKIDDDYNNLNIPKLLDNTFLFTKSDADVYICVSPIRQKIYLDYLNNINRTLDAVIVWDKNSMGMGYMKYRRRCEFILYSKGKPFRRNKDTSDVDLWSIPKDNIRTYKHPNQKPIELAKRAILNSSRENDIILDTFGGSGSTLIACEETNRICYMMEIEPSYCDVIVERYHNYIDKNHTK